MDEPSPSSPNALTRREAVKLMAAGAGALLAGPTLQASAPAPNPWQSLQAKLAGSVVRVSDPGYEAVRAGLMWNGLKAPRKPDAIIHANSEADVRETVRFARTWSQKVAVRGAGHSFIATSICDGGLLIDVSGMDEVEIDAARRTARVQPGVRNEVLTPLLTAQGLAFPVGHCATVPLSGYLLNGGFGWNSNVWGPACFSVTGIELVTAEGESIFADENTNPDYFWAARGAGPGFFGVVTRYHLRLHELPQAIRTSLRVFSLDDIEVLAPWLSDLYAALPPGVELTCLVNTPPQAHAMSGPTPKVLTLMATAFAGTEEEARRWLTPLDGAPAQPVHAESLLDTPIEALLAMMDANAFPRGWRYSVDFMGSQSEPKDFLPLVLDQLRLAPSPRSVLMFLMPPAPPPGVPKPDMAFSLAARSLMGVYGIWEREANDAENQRWVRSVTDRLEAVATSGYIGESDLTRAPGRAERCFAPENWERLQQLKARLDPQNRFHSYPSSP